MPRVLPITELLLAKTQRYATNIQTVAAEQVAFDQRHLRAQCRRGVRRHQLWFAKTSQRQTRPSPHGPSRLCWTMVACLIQIARLLITLASRHRSLVFENLALRQQLAVYHRARPKPTVRWSDRLFWVGLQLAWPDWKSALVIVRPATVIAWHRRGFAWYWTRRSRPRGGRPQVDADVRRLTREMALANPLSGARRVFTESC
jgi:hypothetical protein